MTRNERIVEAVRGGMTYSQAARALDVTRCVVSGVCRRAGLKVGREGYRAGSGAERTRESWMDADIRKRRSEGMRRAWRDPIKKQRLLYGRRDRSNP